MKCRAQPKHITHQKSTFRLHKKLKPRKLWINRHASWMSEYERGTHRKFVWLSASNDHRLRQENTTITLNEAVSAFLAKLSWAVSHGSSWICSIENYWCWFCGILPNKSTTDLYVGELTELLEVSKNHLNPTGQVSVSISQWTAHFRNILAS